MLEERDTVVGLGEVERVSDTFAWINGKRYKHTTLERKQIIYNMSPNTKVDWTNSAEVKKYYDSFKTWGCNICMGDSKKREIFEVKDNMIFHDGEYYLPWRYDRKETIEDGFVFGYLVKKLNNWWSLDKIGGTTVNLFWSEKVVSKEFMDNQTTKKRNHKSMNDIDFLKSIDLSYITGKELNLLKDNIIDLFDASIFPYTVNNVTFYIDNVFGRRIGVSHRNRTGKIWVDNGYYGQMPYDVDYYAIVKVDPDFTNECGYESSVRREITFDTNLLDKLSTEVVKKWDLAIERNAKLYMC